MIRLIKAALAAFASLFCLFYALQNIANLQAAFGFVAYVGSMADHLAYPNAFGPAVTNPTLTWILLWIIIGLEILAGLLAGKGAVDMLLARNASAADFHAAKKWAVVGCGVGVLVWFGIFGAFAGAYFQMWQNEAGTNALQGSFTYSLQMGLVWLLIAATDD